MHYFFPLFYIDYITTNIDDVRVVHDWVIVTLKLRRDMKYAFSIEELSESCWCSLASASRARLYCFARALLPNRHHIGHRRFIVAYIMHVNDLSLSLTIWIFGLYDSNEKEREENMRLLLHCLLKWSYIK